MGYLKNAFCFFHASQQAFGRSQWPLSQVTYIYYRYLFAFYVIGWDILITIRGSYQYGGWYQVDLKVWTFHLLAVYSFISVVSALVDWVRIARWRYDAFLHKEARPTHDDGILSTSRSTLGVGPEYAIYRSVPWHYKVDWLLFNLNVSMHPVVTILYYISPIGRSPIEGVDTFSDIIVIHLTIVNTALVVLDLVIRRISLRIIHVVYPMAVWVIYVTVNVIVQFAVETGSNKPETFLYPEIFDWNAEGDVAPMIGYTLGFFFGIPVIHVIAFALIKLRRRLSRRYDDDVENFEDDDFSTLVDSRMSSGLCCSACGRGRASHDVVFS